MIHSEEKYNVAQKMIHLLKDKNLLKDRYTGQVDVDSYMKLWDTMFEIIEIVEEDL